MRTFEIKKAKSKIAQVEFPIDKLLAIYVRLSSGEQADDMHESMRMQKEGQ